MIWRTNAKDDMAAIVATGAEIATHGLTHTDMTTLNPNPQFMEFAASKIFLSTWLEFPRDLLGRSVFEGQRSKRRELL